MLVTRKKEKSLNAVGKLWQRVSLGSSQNEFEHYSCHYL